MDAANVVFWLDTGGAVTKVVCSAGRKGEGKGEAMWLGASVEWWSCSRGASCVAEYTMGRLRDWSL